MPISRLQELINMGVPPSAHVLEKGWTALHFAALQGNEVRSPVLPFPTILLQYHLSTMHRAEPIHCINPIALWMPLSIYDTSSGCPPSLRALI